MSKRILLTAFGATSAEKLLTQVYDYDVLLLLNDKVLDGELLLQQISNQNYDLIISIGQKPNIKDKICIETTAFDRNRSIKTTVNCKDLTHLFGAHGIHAKLSDNAGKSFCNALYWHGLRYITENRLATEMVFVHVPFEKNICDMQSFQNNFLRTVDALREETCLHG